jgi:hypothetical protein
MSTILVPVLNSLLFIRDSEVVDLPEIDGSASSWSTEFCVAVSCQPDSDGPTAITMDTIQNLRPNGILLLDHYLKTPSRKVVVEGVLANKILESAVAGENTRIRIWTDGHRGTEKVIIGLN